MSFTINKLTKTSPIFYMLSHFSKKHRQELVPSWKIDILNAFLFQNILISNLEQGFPRWEFIWIRDGICGASRDLVPFVQFEKREKHPWRSVDFSKVTGWSLQLKLTLLHGCFSGFLNCTNGIKLRNASHISEEIRTF